jgi:hypothetical protein
MSTPGSDSPDYPVDANGFVRQCAWCRRIVDADGQYRLVSATLIDNASHGCCAACEIRFLSSGAAGQREPGRTAGGQPSQHGQPVLRVRFGRVELN